MLDDVQTPSFPVPLPFHAAAPARPPGPRLLLVEAEQAVSDALQRGLRRAGWNVLRASAAGAALQAMPAYFPDVVLLSLDLPDMGGAALVERLVQQGGCTVIAMSGRGEAARRGILARGAHDYLPKPMRIGELLARLHDVAPSPARFAEIPG